MKAVMLRHPETKGVWACPAAAVDGWLAKGWKRAEAVDAVQLEAAESDTVVDVVAPRTTTRKDK